MESRKGRRSAAAALALALGWASADGAQAQVSLKVNRVIQVAATGTPTQNCQAARDAINGIADATDVNPYLVKLEPGIYDCGAAMLAMRPFISVEGAGQATMLRGFSISVVELASNSELRSVNVENSNELCDENLYAISAFVFPVSDARVFDVIAVSPCEEVGIAYYGQAPAGFVDVAIDHSELRGGAGSIDLNSANDSVSCSFSILDGPITAPPGSATCVMCADAGNTLLDADCAP